MIKKQSAWVLFHYENFQHKFMLCWYLSALIGLFTLNNQSECLKISEKIFIGSSLEVTAQCWGHQFEILPNERAEMTSPDRKIIELKWFVVFSLSPKSGIFWNDYLRRRESSRGGIRLTRNKIVQNVGEHFKSGKRHCLHRASIFVIWRR